ncbi:serine/threonine protein kinase [Blastopirellula marina]|uniref:Protein kinase domain-containing protein n=1 Tax=Blastopirellula marina TaxID=124 RepID=A0A2S8F9N3_9BACT|nr:serine/threonine protein kinase [Blastopirellula marina]PQO28840.1 hypothetical protein C5Y98_24040 [Blastopirellula marina]PTL42113.1 hypothetical protein C5Y97_24055 [Blastopirellula marina]
MSDISQSRLAQMLDKWEEAAERGEELDVDALCADAPELREELKRQIDALKSMNQRLQTSEATTQCQTKAGLPHDEPECFTSARFRELRWLAQGGLGAVYRAQDDMLHREVVLKFIHRHISENEDQRSVFRREAEVTSRLDHPGVVPVYGLGESYDGRIFYVMRYIQGETLDEAIARLHPNGEHNINQTQLRKLLGQFVTVCKTIAYAHNRGIIHRDIKPSNIMLGKYGETLVVDWGLAQPFGRDEQFRQTGEETLMPSDSDSSQGSDHGAGTPAYMSPEVAEKAVILSPATDIYSLGGTLYKILTGVAPFNGSSFPQIRQQILSGDFPPPTQRQRGLSKAIEAICLKAMALDPNRRYATALELANDIESYLADEPVQAYTEPATRRVARWSRRHRSLVGTMLVSVAVLMAIITGSALWLGYMARSEHDARLTAELAKQHSLQTSAKFAARTIAGQIDLRWRILEAAVREAEIKQAMADINQQPDDLARWEPAQAWLNQQYIQFQEENALDVNSLFLLDVQGRQVARSPMSNTIGNSYAFRDYFHGLGHDLTEAEAANVPPIQQANLSATYSSDTSETLKVAFTVPIFSGSGAQQKVIGVLGMSVELGDFGILDTDLSSNQMVVLIDLRPDTIDDVSQRGLILHHPAFESLAGQHKSTRIDQDTLAKIDAEKTSLRLSDYLDPITGELWNAAVERVVVEGRRGPNRTPGWAVMVQERAGQ